MKRWRQGAVRGAVEAEQRQNGGRADVEQRQKRGRAAVD